MIRCAVLVLAIALVEGMVLWSMGFRYYPKGCVLQAYAIDVAVSADGRIAAYVMRLGTREASLSTYDIMIHPWADDQAVRFHQSALEPLCVALAPAGDALAASGTDNWVYVWQAEEGVGVSARTAANPPRRFARAAELPTALCFSPDGRFLAATGDEFTSVWSWPSGELLHHWSHGIEAYGVCSFTRDSRQILVRTMSDGLSLVDLATGAERSVYPRNDYYTGEVSPDGQLAAIVAGNQVRVLRTETGEPLWQRPVSERFIAFVPGNRYLAVVGRESLTRKIQILEALSGKLIRELPSGKAFPLVVNASESLLVYADFDGTVVAWNVNDFSEAWRVSALTLGKR